MSRYRPTAARQKEILTLLHEVKRWIESNRQAGATIASFERRLGVARGTVSRWLNKKRFPTKKQIERLELITSINGRGPAYLPPAYGRKEKIRIWVALQEEGRMLASESAKHFGESAADKAERQYHGDSEDA